MLCQTTVYPVGKAPRTKKGKIQYSFVAGKRPNHKGFIEGSVTLVTAWSDIDYPLEFDKPIQAVLNVEEYATQLVELIGIEGGEKLETEERKF